MNRDVEPGVTIHWHGVDVPNAEDGVAGVTQDAVPPGGSYTYRFRADQTGTFWYHSHESSSTPGRARAVRRVRDRAARAGGRPDAGPPGGGARARRDRDARRSRRRHPARACRRARSCGSASSTPTTRRSPSSSPGTPFRVVAIDGTDLNRPGLIDDHPTLRVAAGGRYDVELTMPTTPVALASTARPPTLVLSPDGRRRAPVPTRPAPDFDPLAYGEPAATPFDASSAVRPRASRSDRPQAGVPRRPPGDAVDAERRDLPGRADADGRAGRPREAHARERHVDGAPDAPPRPPRARALARRAAGHAAARGGRTRSTSARLTLRRRVPGGQPGALDGALPQPEPRRRGPDDAPGVRGRRHPVPRRGATPTTIRSSASWRAPASCRRGTRSSR